jgi:ribosome-binding ATPase YchF (GTP1/OBG family)
VNQLFSLDEMPESMHQGENPEAHPMEAETLHREKEAEELLQPVNVNSQEASRIVAYLQRQSDLIVRSQDEFVKELEARDREIKDAILNMQAQNEEAAKQLSELLSKAGLSLRTMDTSASSTIQKLSQATDNTGKLGQALLGYAKTMHETMQAQVKESAQQAATEIWADLRPRFEKAIRWMWIALGVFVVIALAILIWMAPVQPQNDPESGSRGQQTAPALHKPGHP